jgi:glycerophosphoryl diester phosphodiesterase
MPCATAWPPNGDQLNPLLDLDARPVIGHRGAAAYAPENTLESFRLALRLGAEALEFDIRRSADGEAMVFHDAILDRTTNLSGPVSRYTAEALAEADAGFRHADPGGGFPFRGTGVRIPTLRQVVAEFPHVPFLIEIKEPEVQEAVARALLEGGAADRSVVAGADWRALAAFRSAPFRLGASRRDIARLYFGLGAPDQRCRSYAVPDTYHGLPVPSGRFVRAARRRDSTVHVWTVDNAELAIRLWRRGVNGIVTNRPDVVRQAREEVRG